MHKMIHYERVVEFEKFLARLNPQKGAGVYGSQTIDKLFDELDIESEKNSGYSDDDFEHEFNVRLPEWFLKCPSFVNYMSELMEHFAKAMKTNIDLGIPEGELQDSLKAQIRIVYHMWSLRKNHKRIYKLTNTSLESLMNTEYPSRIEYVKSPYQTLYLMFPNENKFKMPRTNRTLEGAYVTLHELSDRKVLTVVLTQKCKRIDEIANEDVYYYELPLINNMSISSAIKRVINRFREIGQDDSKSYANNNEKEKYYTLIKETSTLIINSLLYITSINSEKKRIILSNKNNDMSLKKAKKFLHRKKSSIDYDLLDISIDGSEHYDSELIGKTSSHKYKYLVRGHWHHYWVNRDNENYKSDCIVESNDNKIKVRKWLSPYWKGPELGDTVLKDYKIS